MPNYDTGSIDLHKLKVNYLLILTMHKPYARKAIKAIEEFRRNVVTYRRDTG